MILDGFGIAGYRSFGSEMVYVKDLGKVNFFIGKNNSGKSNILRFCKHLSQINMNHNYTGFKDNLDFCINSQKREILFGIQIKKDSMITGKYYHKIRDILPQMDRYFPDWKESIMLKFHPLYLQENKRPQQLSVINNPGVAEIAERIVNVYDYGVMSLYN